MEFEKFCIILSECLPDRSVNIFPDSKLADDLCLCSFDMMVIIDSVERVAGATFFADRLIGVKTVRDLYDAFFKGDTYG